MRSRRSYLAAVGVSLATATGCLSGGDGSDGNANQDGTTDRPTRTNVGTESTATNTQSNTVGTTTSPGSSQDFTVSNVAVREAVSYYLSPASTEILAPTGKQFVLADVDGPEGATPPEFLFEANDQTWNPGVMDRPFRSEAVVDGRRGGMVAGSNDASGYLVFTVPSPLETSNPRITTGDGAATWGASESTINRLADPAPMFTLEEFGTPDQVTQGDRTIVSMTVRNTSDVYGRFLGAIRWPTHQVYDDDESHVVGGGVDAGGTASFSASIDTAHTVRESGTITVSVEGYVSEEQTVEVVREDS